jgi:hypothetical protein
MRLIRLLHLTLLLILVSRAACAEVASAPHARQRRREPAISNS